MNKICVLGLGRLGCPIAAVFAKRGFEVVGIDLDQAKVDAINSGATPIKEQGLGELVSRGVASGHLRATVNAADAVSGSEACIFVTATPSLPNGSFDCKQLLEAVESVAKATIDDRFLFIIASTVTPKTCAEKILPVLAKYNRCHLVYKPEFIALGTVIRDLQFPDFHLIGESSDEAGAMAADLYGASGKFLTSNIPCSRMSLIEAELAKISLNCFITMKISFANQLGMVADKLGADPHKILDAIGADRRIGRSALKPGLPYAGPCFPRDNEMFIYVAHEVEVRASLSIATDHINDDLIDSIVALAANVGAESANWVSIPIGILGTAYKPGTAITDESAATHIAARMPGRTVKTHDPMAEHSHSLEEVLDCPVVIVATPWPEYSALYLKPDTFLIDPMHVVRTRYIPLERRVAQ